MKKLFLDDNRMPDEVVGDIYESGWDLVGTHQEFQTYIMEVGMPDVISFDHDLVDEHYDIDWYEVYVDGLLAPTSAPTGFDCLKWLVNFCKESNMALPTLLCHSMNPIGKQEIEKYINDLS